jgi:transposase
MKNNDQAASDTAKPKRKKYSPQFKELGLERAKQDGVPKAAKDLGIAQAMLYSWQAKSRQTGRPFEEQKLQQAEIARLKRENARLEEEVAFLKKAAVDSMGHCNTAKIFSAGDKKFNVFLGRSFNSPAIASSCSCV